MLGDGNLVVSTTTDYAERGLNALIDFLNREFGFRMPGESAKRSYVSTVVVEFEKPISEIIRTLSAVQKLLSNEGGGDRFEMLRPSFSRGAQGMPYLQSLSPLDQAEQADFTIERRASVPFSANRFFCTAPMQTNGHIKILEKIEHVVA